MTGALSAFYAIHETQPDLVINAGTAGGFKSKGAAIGDAFISTVCAHHDRRIPIPGFVPYGKGTHPSVPAKNLIEVFIVAKFVFPSVLAFLLTAWRSALLFLMCLIFQFYFQTLSFKSGVVTTGNSLDHTETVRFITNYAQLHIRLIAALLLSCFH